MTARGQVAIPADVRRTKQLKAGDGFEVFTTIGGDIVLRRVKAPTRKLREHLRGLRGLRITATDGRLPAPVSL